MENLISDLEETVDQPATPDQVSGRERRGRGRSGLEREGEEVRRDVRYGAGVTRLARCRNGGRGEMMGG